MATRLVFSNMPSTWTKKELKSTRFTISMNYLFGRLRVTTKEMVIKPVNMTAEDFNTLNNLMQKYGKCSGNKRMAESKD